MEKIITFCIGGNDGRAVEGLPSKAALKSLVNASFLTLNDLLANTPANASKFYTPEGSLHLEYSNSTYNDAEDQAVIAEWDEVKKTASQTLQLIIACFRNQPELVLGLLESENIDVLKNAVLSSLVRCEMKKIRVDSSTMWQNR